MPDDPQPDEGQGTQGGSPYDSYLQTVPEQAKEAAEAWFRDTSKGLEAKLEQAAELQKTLGPYQQVDTLSAYQPEQLSELLAWHQQVTSSDEAFREWLGNAAKEAGLTAQEERTLEDAEVQGELSREEVHQLIQQTAEERIAPIQEQFQTLQVEKMVDQETQSIDEAFAQIQRENKLELSKDQRAIILDLGMPLAFDAKGNDLPAGDSSWVQKGFERWNNITTEGQKAFVEEKAKGPGTPISTGATAAFKPATDFKSAGEQARERWRQMQT